MWKLNKSIARELLPSQPIDFVVDPWWGVCLVNFTLEEFKVNFKSILVPCSNLYCSVQQTIFKKITNMAMHK